MEATAVERQRVGTQQSHMFWGIIFFLISEAFLFGALFTTYYYLRVEAAVWPPAHPAAGLATMNTFFLLASSGTIWWATRAIRKGSEKGLALGLLATFLLGSTFLGITAWEWGHEPFRPWTHAYGSIFFTLTGFHALHVFGGVMLMSALLARTLRHRFSAQHFQAVEVGSMYWHFVDFIWLFVFSTIFIVR